MQCIGAPDGWAPLWQNNSLNYGHAFPVRQQDQARVEPSNRVLSPQSWTIGISGWCMLVLSNPPQYLSSRRCMSSRGCTVSVCTTLDGGAAKGYTRVPPVERAAAVQLSPNSTLGRETCLPFRACRYSSEACWSLFTLQNYVLSAFFYTASSNNINYLYM